MAGIYIHIPYCRQACYYCDFHFSTNLANRAAMVDALCKELSLRSAYLGGEQVNTIYFGGGTPSLLTSSELDQILSSVHERFVVSQGAEVTLEANPDDLGGETLADLHTLGVNRLSIGVQSFDDHILRSLNRIHDASSARKSIERAKASGFENISIDLIYAIPGLDHERWKASIDEAIRHDPQHISSYSLTIEEKTMFGKWQRLGKFHTVDDDVAADQHEILVERLEQAGFEHYEVSNFARGGYVSQHNSSYWREQRYLGIGPGAHSYDIKSRQHNVRDNRRYITAITNGEVPSITEILSQTDKLNEYLLISLRTNWGASLKKLHLEFGFDLVTIKEKYLEQLMQNGLATVTGDAFVLTNKGRLLADEIVVNLVPGRSQPEG